MNSPSAISPSVQDSEEGNDASDRSAQNEASRLAVQQAGHIDTRNPRKLSRRRARRQPCPARTFKGVALRGFVLTR